MGKVDDMNVGLSEVKVEKMEDFGCDNNSIVKKDGFFEKDCVSKAFSLSKDEKDDKESEREKTQKKVVKLEGNGDEMEEKIDEEDEKKGIENTQKNSVKTEGNDDGSGYEKAVKVEGKSEENDPKDVGIVKEEKADEFMSGSEGGFVRKRRKCAEKMVKYDVESEEVMLYFEGDEEERKQRRGIKSRGRKSGVKNGGEDGGSKKGNEEKGENEGGDKVVETTKRRGRKPKAKGVEEGEVEGEGNRKETMEACENGDEKKEGDEGCLGRQMRSCRGPKTNKPVQGKKIKLDNAFDENVKYFTLEFRTRVCLVRRKICF